MISNNILEQIGNTPIVRVQSLSDEFDCNVFMKMESFNPGGSHKARIALNMIEDAESKGILIPGSGQTLIEGTGGNTGLGLLMAANLKGYKVILVIPDNYSPRKMKLLRMFGAKVIQSDSSLGNNSHGDLTQEIQSQNPDFVWLNQQRNSANPGAHKSNTSQEIFSQIGANSVDFMVAGIGSGGHISGVGEELKSRFPEAKVVAIEPEGCSLLEDKHVFHQIQGLSVGLIPETLNTQVIDKSIHVVYNDCVNEIVNLARKESLSIGLSTAANIAGIKKLAGIEDVRGKNILTFCYDNVDSYIDDISWSG